MVVVMKGPDHLRKRLIKLALIVGLWTLIGLFLFIQALMIIDAVELVPPERLARLSAKFASPAELLIIVLAHCYVWAFLAVAIFWLARRFPVERRRWQLSLPVHLAAAVAGALVASQMSRLGKA
jgi:hypothetical protein